VEKYYRAGQATEDNVAHAHCMLGTLSYKHTLRICITYCFSTTAAFLKLWSADHKWSSGSALVVLLD